MNNFYNVRLQFWLWCLLSVSHQVWAGEHELKITALSDQVYLHTSFHETDSYGWVGAHGLVVIHESGAYIIDTPWSEADTKQLQAWISDEGYKLMGSVSTHFHADRTAGIDHLNVMKVPTHASKLTNQLLADLGQAQATHAFTGNTFSWLPEVIEVYYPGGGHSKDNVVVWLPQEKLLFGGCLIRSIHSKTLGNTSDAVVSDWAESASHVLAKYGDVKTVVPGHGSLGGIELIKHTIQLAQKHNEK